ncbi:hypothetical protein A8C32_17220 [Flavivirga aquatica]|uniref:Rieske domain-containing protein n=1 Tax=Flavivirga aquatica TaxID=1849968 RepID=A0A1E5T8A6_9FLAO|nr:aromatic ring-hydroxylating dioxygenase subunit alpha [Flavivirga aquatica]OEK07537.1 hypothetical protein A8C32_17220 [Flavivirga aquatica]
MENFNDIDAETVNLEQIKSLPSNAYTDPEIFKRERYDLFRYIPVMATPVCLLPNIGNYVVIDIAEDSVIVTRNDKEEIKAMANTCRHRGKRLVDNKTDLMEPQKGFKSIVCPYHAWSYDLNGKLLKARGDESNSAFKHLCLRKLQVQESAGLVFYHGHHEQYERVKNLEQTLGSLNLKEAKVGARKTYDVKANWKLWTENFLECWHCASSHPELRTVKGFIDQFEGGREDLYIQDSINWASKAEKKKWKKPIEEDFNADKDLFHFNVNMPLGGDTLTASKDGKRMGATLGNAEGLEGGAIFGCMGPFLFYLAYVDYILLVTLKPKSADNTEVELIWLTSADFSASEDELTWLWDTTIKQDIKLIEETQSGVSSIHYTPGPFQADEYRTRSFVSWWKKWEQKNEN